MKTSKLKRPRDEAGCIPHSRWLAYATASAATVLAGATSAEAAITYSGPVNLALNFPAAGYHTYFRHIPLTGGVSLDPAVFRATSPDGATVIGAARFRLGRSAIFPGAKTQVVGFTQVSNGNAYLMASRLGAGLQLSLQNFHGFLPDPEAAGFFGNAYLAVGSGYPGSQWVGAGKTGFVGFKFDAGNGTQFGWARITMNSGPLQNTFTLNDFAFAGPGESLATGQIPEPGSLGLLALGGAGLLAWRKRRAMLAKATAA